MTQKELIRQEIERRKKENMYVDLPMSIGRYYEDRELLAFIDSLPDENQKPELVAKVWESGHGFRDLEMDSESFRKALEGFKDGDKVKLFIVKEDDEG